MKTAAIISALCVSVALLAANLPAQADNAPAIPKPMARPIPAPPTTATPSPAGPAGPPSTPAVVPSAPADGPAAPAAKAQSGRYLNTVLLGSATYRQTMLVLFRGKRNVPFWVRNMISYPDYVSGISEQVEINGKSYELFSACSPKICATSNLRVLFTPDGKSGWLRTRDPATGEMFFGEPSPDQRLLLQKSGL